MDYGASKNASVRRRAEDKFAKAKQRDMDVMGHQRQLQQAEAAKLIRLRALRLAKEAADRDALAKAEAEALAAGPEAQAGSQAQGGQGSTGYFRDTLSRHGSEHGQGRDSRLGVAERLADDRRSPELGEAGQTKEAIVRIVLKGTVANLEIKKPSGKWEKVSGAAYGDIKPDPETGMPRGLGLVSITGLTMLDQENKDRRMLGMN